MRQQTRTRTAATGPTSFVRTTEHQDGRVDVVLQPSVEAFFARVHRSGKRRGEVAELTRKGGGEVDPAGLVAVTGGNQSLHALARLAQLSAVEEQRRAVNLRELVDKFRGDERGAITASGYYGLTLEKQLIDTLGKSLESEVDIKVLMVEDGYTPDYNAHNFRDDLTNEVAGTGYTAGGKLLTTTEITIAAGVLTYDGDDVSWTASTIPAAMAAVGYVARGGASSADELIWLSDFVTAASTTNGTFTIQWNASGIITIDFTP